MRMKRENGALCFGFDLPFSAQQPLLLRTLKQKIFELKDLNPMLIKIQPNARVCRYLFTAKSLYMFRVTQHPSSGVLKTVIAASGTGGTATSFQRGLIGHVGGK